MLGKSCLLVHSKKKNNKIGDKRGRILALCFLDIIKQL